MVRRALAVGIVTSLMVVSAWAVDVVLRDGTVIPAVSYKVSGSYVMVQLEGGGQVAYDLGDVDLGAMRKAEAAAAGAEAPTTEEAPPAGNVISQARSESSGTASLTISDSDVRHVGGPAESAAPEEDQAREKRREGGLVALQGIRVLPGEKPGQWEATGEVVNRADMTVMDVRALIQAMGPDRKPVGEAEVPVAASLEPGGKGTFSHTFTAVSRPLLKVRVFWMQQEAPSATPAPGRARPGGPGVAPPPRPEQTEGGQRPRGAAGSRPSDLQWGGAPAYRHAGPATPTPTR